MKDNHSLWHIIFSIVFVMLIIFMTYLLDFINNDMLKNIRFFDFVILSRATFRLIRLFTYDKIMQFLRDIFAQSRFASLKTINELITCPWCTGIWMSLFIVYLYFLHPGSWLFILVLAVAGTGSLIQIFANMMGRINNKN